MAVLILSSSLLRLANRAFSLTPRLLSESFSSSYAARVGITNQEGGWLSGIILKICDFSYCASSLSVIFKIIMFSEIRGVLSTSLYIKNPTVLTESCFKRGKDIFSHRFLSSQHTTVLAIFTGITGIQRICFLLYIIEVFSSPPSLKS